jgi:hypothetical protein
MFYEIYIFSLPVQRTGIFTSLYLIIKAKGFLPRSLSNLKLPKKWMKITHCALCTASVRWKPTLARLRRYPFMSDARTHNSELDIDSYTNIRTNKSRAAFLALAHDPNRKAANPA